MRKNQYYYENLYKRIKSMDDDEIGWLKSIFNYHIKKHDIIEKIIEALYQKIRKLFKLKITKEDVYVFLGCKRSELKKQILKTLVFYHYSIVDFVYFFNSKYDIDLIVPVKKFDISTVEGIKSVFNYTNIQVVLKPTKKKKPSKVMKRINTTDYLGPFW